ncbi:MAG: carbohydrate ABC transporter permease [Spirochaetales bacterium]|nr:carbohydrate ABC transporter permease [Spirochaetales bacterium]
MSKQRKKLTHRQKERLAVGIKIFLGILFMSPIFIGLVFSFVPDDELYELPTIQTIIDNFTFYNYAKVLRTLPILSYIKTSLVMCAIVIVVQITVTSLSAYAFAFFNFRFKNLLFTLVLIAMMIPGQVVTITNFLTIRALKLLNTYLGLTIVSFTAGRSLFMFRQSYLSLPREMKEAATVDGCSELRYLFQFAIPLSLPSIASISIMIFIGEFNAYLWPLLVSREPRMYTIQIGMAQMIGSDAIPNYGSMMAVAMISLVIPIIAFIIGEDYLIAGMTRGAVKG